MPNISDVAFQARENIIKLLEKDDRYKNLPSDIVRLVEEATTKLQELYTTLDKPPKVITSKAGAVLEKIRKMESLSDQFQCEYTSINYLGDCPYMKVQDIKLFNDLTEPERVYFSTLDEKHNVLILNIWTHTWVYLFNFDKWVLVSKSNEMDASYSWYPEYVSFKMGEDIYLLDTTHYTVYKEMFNYG